MSKKYSTINTLIYCLCFIYIIWELFNVLYVFQFVESSPLGFWMYSDNIYWGVRCVICLLMFLLCLFLPRINKVIKYLSLVSLPFICGVICFCAFNVFKFSTPNYVIEHGGYWESQDLGLPSEIRLRTSHSYNDTTIYNLIDPEYYDEFISEEKLYAEISEHCYVRWEDAVTKFTSGKYFVVVSIKTGNYILLAAEFIKRIFGEDVYYANANIERFGYYNASNASDCVWGEDTIPIACDTTRVDTAVVNLYY